MFNIIIFAGSERDRYEVVEKILQERTKEYARTKHQHDTQMRSASSTLLFNAIICFKFKKMTFIQVDTYLAI